MIGHSLRNSFHAIGNIKTVAVAHLKNANVTGGMSWLKALAMMKFPLQIMVARTANAMPVHVFEIVGVFLLNARNPVQNFL